MALRSSCNNVVVFDFFYNLTFSGKIIPKWQCITYVHVHVILSWHFRDLLNSVFRENLNFDNTTSIYNPDVTKNFGWCCKC